MFFSIYGIIASNMLLLHCLMAANIAVNPASSTLCRCGGSLKIWFGNVSEQREQTAFLCIPGFVPGQGFTGLPLQFSVCASAVCPELVHLEEIRKDLRMRICFKVSLCASAVWPDLVYHEEIREDLRICFKVHLRSNKNSYAF